MNKTIYIPLVLALCAFIPDAKAQVGKTHEEGQVTAVTYLKIEYGRLDEYVKWLSSTWKPTMEAKKKAGSALGRTGRIESRQPGEHTVSLKSGRLRHGWHLGCFIGRKNNV